MGDPASVILLPKISGVEKQTKIKALHMFLCKALKECIRFYSPIALGMVKDRCVRILSSAIFSSRDFIAL